MAGSGAWRPFGDPVTTPLNAVYEREDDYSYFRFLAGASFTSPPSLHKYNSAV
jgi:hypothetical protein